MKRIVLLAIMIFTLCSLEAAVVRGRVVNEAGEGIDFVNVALKPASQGGALLGATTNERGIFVIENVPTGKYTLEISFIGYETYTRTINIANAADVVRAGNITLKEDSKVLDAVEVVGQASQMRFDIDKKVFNVDQNLAAAGASVSEMLQNIPSVDVDQEGNISLRNNSSVEVWINGKPAGLTEDNRAQVLEQMPAGSIEAVEIITNPSAKYDPEGTAGVINLVLKKDRKAGYYGSVSAGTHYAIGSMPGARLGFNFNYNSSLVDFYINFGGRYMNDNNQSGSMRYSFTPGTNHADTISFLNNEVDGWRQGFGMFGRAGADFHIDKKSTIALSVMGHGGMNWSRTLNSYTRYLWNPLDTLLYERNNTQNGKMPSYNVGLDYIYDIDGLGSDVRIGVEYSGHSRSGDYNYIQQAIQGDIYEYSQVQRSNGNNQSARFKADYTQKFGTNMKLEAGLYGSWQDRFSPSRTWNLTSDGDSLLIQYNDFRYQEWIAAAYATYGARFGGFSFSLGLRGEYTNTYVETRESDDAAYASTSRSYFQLYPTAFVSYAFPGNHELQANYTRRINRPRGRQLNAFRNMSDSTNIEFGNPLLNPEISSAVELNYIKTWDDHAITASLFYRFTDNVIQCVRYLDQNDVMNTTYENIALRQSAGAEFVAKNKVAKWLNLTTTIAGFYSGMNDIYYDADGDGEAELLYARENSFSWNVRLMANFLIPQNWSAQLTAQYRSADVVAQGRQNQSYSIDLGVRKSFLDRKLNLNFTIRDVLNSRRWASTTWGDNFWQYSEWRPHGTQFALTLTYNFGNGKAKRRPMDQNGMDMDDSMDSMDF